MSSTPVLYAEPVEAALPAVVQPDTDARTVDLWVSRHESPNTRRNYRRQARLFLTFVRRPLATVGIGDLQAYLASRAVGISNTGQRHGRPEVTPRLRARDGVHRVSRKVTTNQRMCQFYLVA